MAQHRMLGALIYDMTVCTKWIWTPWAGALSMPPDAT